MSASTSRVRKLDRRAILAELRAEVRMYQVSCAEIDGVVRDKGALRTMAALTAAIEIIKGGAR